MNIFWDTITHYNAGTWIYQVIITLIGIILTCSLFKSPTKKIKVAMKLSHILECMDSFRVLHDLL